MDVYHSKVPTVVVLVNGGPLAINQIQQNVPAILEVLLPLKWINNNMFGL